MTVLSSRILARVTRQDPAVGLTSLWFGAGEFRVPHVAAEVGAILALDIDARDVAVALSRPMDVSITNRFPGTIVAVDHLEAPYALVTFDLGGHRLDALVTWESVDRLALEPGLSAWAMVKSVALAPPRPAVGDETGALMPPEPRPWPAPRPRPHR